MIRRYLYVVLVFAIVVAAVEPLAAQKRKSRRAVKEKAVNARDDVRLMYDFAPGQTVRYQVVTYDTLVLNGANRKVQSAERSHIVSYTCDSVVHDGFAMTMSYDDYSSRERTDTLPAVTRTTHPWTRRVVSFVIRRDGRRTRFLSRSDSASVSPAGPFQSLLMPYLGEPFSYVGASNTFRTAHTLLDNAIPAVVWQGSIFRTIDRRVDTLGVPAIEIAIAQTGRAAYEASKGTSTSAVTNGSERYWFSPLLGFTVAGEIHAIYNLTFATPRGDAEGRQIISTRFAMVASDVSVAPADTTFPNDIRR